MEVFWCLKSPHDIGVSHLQTIYMRQFIFSNYHVLFELTEKLTIEYESPPPLQIQAHLSQSISQDPFVRRWAGPPAL